MSIVEKLDWDTEFFGIPIGRIHLDGASDEAIAEAELEAQELGLRCLYASLDPADRLATFRVQQLGYRFVEAATMFEVALTEPPIPRPGGVHTRAGTEEDFPALEPMIDAMADWSRFAIDPHFGREAARRMQWASVTRAAASDDDSYSLSVAEDDDGLLAFVTRRRDPHPRVDAVGTTSRGSGSARYLIEVAREWARPASLHGGDIAARNVAALRYVSHCGYRVHRVRYIYHRWLDEDGGATR